MIIIDCSFICKKSKNHFSLRENFFFVSTYLRIKTNINKQQQNTDMTTQRKTLNDVVLAVLNSVCRLSFRQDSCYHICVNIPNARSRVMNHQAWMHFWFSRRKIKMIGEKAKLYMTEKKNKEILIVSVK